jgi:hypothetical protein
LRRRLIHCETRTPFYFQAKPPRPPSAKLNQRQNNVKENLNLTRPMNQRIDRKLVTKRPLSLTDQNKFYRTTYTNSFTGIDHSITKTRHTTFLII